MRSRILYTAGRLCAVVTRPLCLFVANNYLSAHAAQALAVAFLASSLGLVAIAADPHRRFYTRQFGTERHVAGLTFYVYVASLILLVVCGGAVVFAIGLHFTGSFALAVVAIVYFVSEKLADELLRLRLFEHDFGAWGRASIARSVLQLTGLAVLFGVASGAAPGWLAVLVLAIGNLIVFVPQLPRSLGRILRGRRNGVISWLVRRAAYALARNWLLWTIVLLSSGIGYVDRLVALIVDRTTLPLFMLIVMCFSIVQLAVDFYYVSAHRRDFLQQQIRVGRALASYEFLGSFSGGLILAAAACVAVLSLSRNGAGFPLAYVMVIATLQASVAVATIPQQILYWNYDLVLILRIELAFWALFACAALSGWSLGLPPVGIFALAAACVLVRLALMLTFAARAPTATSRS